MAVDEHPIVQLWDGAVQRRLNTLTLADDVALTTAFFPDGRRAASGGADGRIRLWNLEAKAAPVAALAMGPAERPTEIAVLGEKDAPVARLAISADGQRVAASLVKDKILLFDLATRKASASYSYGRGTITALTFLPDSKGLLAAICVSGSPDRICHLDLATGATCLSTPYHRGRINSIVVSPDGQLLVSTSLDGTAGLWECPSLKWRGAFRAHSGYVTSAAFAPDGRTLATASNDGTVKLWSVENQEELFTLPGSIAPGTRLAFSPAGTELAGCGEDGMLRVWRAAASSEAH
jgi:WD40 repeat protein